MMKHEKIQEFVDELSGFAETAEQALATLRESPDTNQHLFAIFSERMFTIRGTATQLGLSAPAQFARLAEEIALKAEKAEKRPQIRRCVGALWDAMTTIKYLIQHHEEETGEEQAILTNRLEKTLEALGGARPSYTPDEIDALIKSR